MAWFLGQSLVFLVLAFLLGMLVGWMVWGRGDRSLATRPQTTPLESFFAPAEGADGSGSAVVIHEPEPMRVPRSSSRLAAAERAREAEPANGIAAEGAATAGPSELIPDGGGRSEPDDAAPQDDLQRIEGIGPKISSVLVASGVHTYQQLADLDRLTLTETLSAGGVKFAPSLATWAEQAQLLARGDEAGFLELAGRLLSDRRAR